MSASSFEDGRMAGSALGSAVGRIGRRVFITRLAAGGAACATVLASTRAAGAPALIDEADPQAAALSYKADTRKVDAGKHPKHTAEQTCGNCQLFAGKATDAAGGCAVFPGKSVATAGWCSAWVKRA